jgi:hypothetical protein
MQVGLMGAGRRIQFRGGPCFTVPDQLFRKPITTLIPALLNNALINYYNF